METGMILIKFNKQIEFINNLVKSDMNNSRDDMICYHQIKKIKLFDKTNEMVEAFIYQ